MYILMQATNVYNFPQTQTFPLFTQTPYELHTWFSLLEVSPGLNLIV